MTNGVRRVDLNWLASLLDEGAKPVAVLSVLLNLYLIRELKQLYSRLLVRGESEKEQQQQISQNVAADNRMFGELMSVGKTLEKLERLQRIAKGQGGDA